MLNIPDLLAKRPQERPMARVTKGRTAGYICPTAGAKTTNVPLRDERGRRGRVRERRRCVKYAVKAAARVNSVHLVLINPERSNRSIPFTVIL